MDFSKFTKQARDLKDQAVTKSKQALSYGASKLADSKITLKTVSELDLFVEKSKNKQGKDSKTGESKEYSQRVIIIFADPKSGFFQDLLYLLPVLSAKAFSQNISLKLADVHMQGLDKKTYNIHNPPSLVLMENMKFIKILEGEEKIQKVVKSLDLDINKTIEEFIK